MSRYISPGPHDVAITVLFLTSFVVWAGSFKLDLSLGFSKLGIHLIWPQFRAKHDSETLINDNWIVFRA